MDDPQDEKGAPDQIAIFPEDDNGEFCDHCSSKAITRENGTPLCETHLNEYKARHG